jgi:hypothetical protein
VPGCTDTHFVDVHHIRPRSDGGRSILAHLVTLCTAHHRAAHRGKLSASSKSPQSTPIRSPSFATPTARPTGERCAPNPLTPTPRSSPPCAISASASEAQAVLADLRADASLRDMSAEHLLREASCRIRLARH